MPASRYQINFVGEDGVDAGGVFREGMSRMVEDLFSPDFDLLVQCPNGRHAVGQVGGTSNARRERPHSTPQYYLHGVMATYISCSRQR